MYTVEEKMENMRRMDDFIKNEMNEESILKYWQTMGLPKEYTIDNLREYASDEDKYYDVVCAYAHCEDLYFFGGLDDVILKEVKKWRE
jgi:hypothetical protein